nr:kunitz-type protease inhibitor 3 [Aotus nancymaae]
MPTCPSTSHLDWTSYSTSSTSFPFSFTLSVSLADSIKDPLPNVCNFPMEKGICRAYFIRWFFNFEAGECESFVDGGCRGNGNNFLNKEECEKICKFT